MGLSSAAGGLVYGCLKVVELVAPEVSRRVEALQQPQD